MFLNPPTRSGRSIQNLANEFRVIAMSRAKSQKPSAGLPTVLVIAALTSLAACTSQLGDLSEPADAPSQTAAQPAYPAVHDMPGPRDTKPMSAEERQRIADELAAARERQEAETTGTVPARPQPGNR
jgi:hypothetical protein